MTTNVSVFAPYIMAGKQVRIRLTYPDGTPYAGDQWLTEPNVIKTVCIHDGAQLEVAEVDAPPLEPAVDPSPADAVPEAS